MIKDKCKLDPSIPLPKLFPPSVGCLLLLLNYQMSGSNQLKIRVVGLNTFSFFIKKKNCWKYHCLTHFFLFVSTKVVNKKIYSFICFKCVSILCLLKNNLVRVYISDV
jgi:hypothetical protein